MKRTGRSWLRLLLLASLVTMVPGVVAGQSLPLRVPPVSVESDHWVYPLLDRMAAAGLLDGVWMAGRRPVGADVVVAALDSAANRAGGGSAWAETAEAAGEWLAMEHGVGGTGVRALPTVAGRLADGPQTDTTAILAGARLVYGPAANVGLWAHPRLELSDDGLELPFPRLGASWSPGPVRITASYEPHRLGPGASGGFILHDSVERGWLQVGLDEPVRLPWALGWLGPTMISASASRFGSTSDGPAVGFFSGEFRFQPFPWATLGVYRTAAVVGERSGETLGPRDLWLIFLGKRTGASANFDDQKASMSGSFRFDLGGLRVNPYFVWAWEDTWEIDEDPGTTLGVWLPSVPIGGTPVGFRYEFSAIGDDGRIIWPWSDDWAWRDWYRKDLRGRSVYSEGDELLGHPLGGYGTEHRVEVDALLPEPGWVLRGALFTRDRVRGTTDNPGFGDPRTVEYSNLLYDVMPGRSWGGVLRAGLQLDRLRLDGDLEVEVGEEGWDRAVLSVRTTWLLP